MSSLMPRLDRLTRTFWRTVGRPVDLGGEHAWLDAPMHDGPGFAAAGLRPQVRDFYERTGHWRMEVSTRRVASAPRPGCARCARRGSTSTAAATPRGACPGRTGPAST
jgi:hypothetical protein